MINWDAVTIKDASAIDIRARRLFAVSATVEALLHRDKYGAFDNMPPDLQEWWRDKAERL